MTALKDATAAQVERSQIDQSMNNDVEQFVAQKSLASCASIPNEDESVDCNITKSISKSRSREIGFTRTFLVFGLLITLGLLSVCISKTNSASQNSMAADVISTVHAVRMQADVVRNMQMESSPSPSPSTEDVSIPATSGRTLYPTFFPTESPTNGPTAETQVATFIGIGDVPYDTDQEEILRQQMDNIDYYDVDFVVHVGDIRPAGGSCRIRQYETAANLLRRSSRPVFIIPGDNDWNDCPNMDEGWEYWSGTFMEFESRYWDHNFEISRIPGRPETFSFIHKGTLFIGLNIVGDEPRDSDERDEWSERLTEQYEWTRDLINDYVSNLPDNRSVGRVVIFGHADPTGYHDDFFRPLANFIDDELRNNVPILYVNGDTHDWAYDSNFYGQSSLLRITLSGEGKDPPTQFSVEADGTWQNPGNAFSYDRRLGSDDASQDDGWDDGQRDDGQRDDGGNDDDGDF